MKTALTIILIVWMLITMIFVFSIIGLVMVVKANHTMYHKYGAEMRTAWMQLGFDIKEALLNK